MINILSKQISKSIKRQINFSKHFSKHFSTTDANDPTKTSTETIFTSDHTLEKVLSNNKKWITESTKSDPNFFDKLGQDQTPDFFYIGCSDSRVPANEIMGLGPGEVFVHRNVANVVMGCDANLLACLQYAVQVLEVKHILVTGHYGCGGVLQALKRESVQGLDSWLRNIRDVYRLHHKELDALTDETARARRLVELNVVESCLNLYKTDIVQQKRLTTWKDPNEEMAYPRIHGMVFDPSEGRLRVVPIDFREQVGKYSHIYDLFSIEDDDFKDQNENEKNDAAHYMYRKGA